MRIFPVSAKLALEGKLGNSEDIVQKSLLPRFSRVLSFFLIEEKGNVLITSAANSLLRLISQARLELELD